MEQAEYLTKIILVLTAAVIAVPLFKKFGLASVLGYLAAGLLIGPSGMSWIEQVDLTLGFSETGVVLLLFLIGLELAPRRLWNMRQLVFGLGSLQLLLTSIPLGLLAWAVYGLPALSAVIVGISLAFSSTAFVMQFLKERGDTKTHFGRVAFGILLFQDIAAVFVLALIPVLSQGADQVASTGSLWLDALKVVSVIALLIGGGRFILRPLLRVAASTGVSEIFTAAALLLVLGSGFLMQSIGGTMALGSFLAGILLADSEYRHELEANLEPFKGLLMGLFFIAIGMSVNLSLILRSPGTILGLVCVLMVIKFVAVYILGRRSGLPPAGSRALAFVLPQGSEFAFVILNMIVGEKILGAEDAQILTVVVTLSLALTPLLAIFNDRVLARFLAPSAPPFDRIDEDENPVIIAGFGRVGQVVARVLRIVGIPFTALDADPTQIEVVKRFGNKVYYGDVTNLELLRSAKLDQARLFVLAIDNVEASVKTARIVKQYFPHLTILARARNRGHAFQLLDAGVDRIWRETLASSIEMTGAALLELGFSNARVERVLGKFRDHDEEMLREQFRFHDEREMIKYFKEASRQLTELLQSDAQDGVPDPEAVEKFQVRG